MKAICVFCGSSSGVREEYSKVAESVGKALAKEGILLVYGGGTSGLMGTTALAALQAGGRVHGVIPKSLQNYERKYPPSAKSSPAHESLLHPVEASIAVPTDQSILSVSDTMHERKMKMASLADAFIVLPGGFGTLEELAEMTTWTQLNIHKKAVVCLDVQGFFKPLQEFVKGATEAGFIRPENSTFVDFVANDQGGDWGTLALEAIHSWTKRHSTAQAFDIRWTQA